MRQHIFDLAQGARREDVSASVQLLLENVIIDSVGRILARHPMRFLGLSGGVFANVRLNQRLAEELPLDEVFIYPSMSDQGLAAGAVLQYLLERDGMEHWLAAALAATDPLLRPRLQRRHRRHLRPRPALQPCDGEPGRRRRRAAAAGRASSPSM